MSARATVAKYVRLTIPHAEALAKLVDLANRGAAPALEAPGLATPGREVSESEVIGRALALALRTAEEPAA